MITGHEPVNILDLRGDAPPERQSNTGTVLYSSGGFLKKDPKYFTRNEKLAFVEHVFSLKGHEANNDKFILEVRFSAGLSMESFDKARQYGLHRFNKQRPELTLSSPSGD